MASLGSFGDVGFRRNFAQPNAGLSEIVASRFVLAKQIVGVVPLSAGIGSR
jgi:hypothetical protein